MFRADTYRRAYDFLVTSHGIQQVFLVFHGAAEDGPSHAVCGDYQRQLPRSSLSEIRLEQERDGLELLQAARRWPHSPPMRLLYAEVNALGQVRLADAPHHPRELASAYRSRRDSTPRAHPGP